MKWKLTERTTDVTALLWFSFILTLKYTMLTYFLDSESLTQEHASQILYKRVHTQRHLFHS